MKWGRKMSDLIKIPNVPTGMTDVILDTDAFNEIDDQFAIAYMLRSKEKLNVKGICAAPFYNSNSDSPKDGMEKSFNEINKLLDLMNEVDRKKFVFKGSDGYLPDEKTPVKSDAAKFLVELANQYSESKPLYIVSIGAITNVASAILTDPSIVDKIVIVWLGGHSLEYCDTKEFNMMQDIAAARVVFGCGVPLVQLPCMGVVDTFRISKYELEFWFKGKNKISDYLAENTISAAEKYASGKPWSRVIWDVTAVAWLLNDNDRFMQSRIIKKHMPNYDYKYDIESDDGFMRYVYSIKRDALMEDLINKLNR